MAEKRKNDRKKRELEAKLFQDQQVAEKLRMRQVTAAQKVEEAKKLEQEVEKY